MLLFRFTLGAMLVGIIAYTGVTISRHGLDLLPFFFLPMLDFVWQGQFNFDFMLMLTLSGLWTAWRNGFTGGAIAMGVFAIFFGSLFLSAYLLFLSYRTGGDARRMLLGVNEGK